MDRKTRRTIINRKKIDYKCPVDREVINLLHEYAIEYKATFDEKGELDGSQLSIDTIKLIRKDVLKQIPGILDGDMTVVPPEPIEPIDDAREPIITDAEVLDDEEGA